MELLKEMLTSEIENANGEITDYETLEIDEFMETEEARLMQEMDYTETINEIKNQYQ